MKELIKHNRLYLILYILMLAIVGYYLWNYDKVTIHKAINAYVGNPYIDVFFKYVTHLGDGVVALIIGGLMLFISVRKSLYILFSYVGAAIVSSLLKYIVYPDVFRPHATFGYFVREKLNLVPGVEMSALRSFPSGHALSAFALFFCLMFMTQRTGLKCLFFLLACIASFSRVYISQHWLIDIYVGSVIGVLFSVLFYSVFYHNSYSAPLDKPLSVLLKNRKQRV